MIKYRSRSHYTLLMIRSAPKTEPELVEMSNQRPSIIKRSIATLERQGLVQETTVERTTGKWPNTNTYTVNGYEITPKGVETLYYLARNQERNPNDTTDYNYDRMLARQAEYRRKRREAQV